ncbi:MAG TPA: transporter [Polyangiaceae bacterium]|nr:transporter [Polyangiaceae bacterium]
MRMGAVGVAILALLTLDSAAGACTCGVPGLESALTSPRELWGTRLAESFAEGHGRWDARGRYRALASGDRERRYELEALAAVRPASPWELSASTSYVRASTSGAGWSSSLSGLGDTFARARYEASEEAPPHREGLPWPSLALTGSLRMPTAHADRRTNLGLGAYEVGLGATVERSIKARLRVSASGVFAWRAPDHSLGAPRRLGPRAAAQIAGLYWPHPDLVLSLASNLTWEADTRYAAERQVGSGSRQWQVGAGAVFRPDGSRLRAGFRVRYAPPLRAVSVNTLGETSLDLSLSYAH